MEIEQIEKEEIKETTWLPICTSVSKEFWQIAQDNKIKWADALRRGLALEFADRGIGDFDNRVTIHGKLLEVQSQIGRQATLIENVLDRIKRIEEKNGI